MNRRTVLYAALASSLALISASPGQAQLEGTVGDCISDGLYGNEPNIVDPFAPGGPSEQEPGTKGGRVVPTQSPGPWVNNPADPDNPTRGLSVGGWRQAGVDVPEICRTLTSEF